MIPKTPCKARGPSCCWFQQEVFDPVLPPIEGIATTNENETGHTFPWFQDSGLSLIDAKDPVELGALGEEDSRSEEREHFIPPAKLVPG